MLRHCQLRVLTTCKTCDEWPVKRGNEEAGSNTLSGGGLLHLRDPRACKPKHEREDSCCAVRQHYLHYRGECPEDDVRNDVSTHVGDEITCANNFNLTIRPSNHHQKGYFPQRKFQSVLILVYGCLGFSLEYLIQSVMVKKVPGVEERYPFVQVISSPTWHSAQERMKLSPEL